MCSQIVINCCRKKFNATAATIALVQLLLALPGFAARAFGFSNAGAGKNFNVAKLSSSVKGVTDDSKKLYGAKKQTVVMKRIERRKKQSDVGDQDGGVGLLGFGAASDAHSTLGGNMEEGSETPEWGETNTEVRPLAEGRKDENRDDNDGPGGDGGDGGD